MALPLPKRIESASNHLLANQSDAQGLSPWRTAEVLATLSPSSVKVMNKGAVEVIAVAGHVPMPVPGQRVLIACAECAPGLIIAAYPLEHGQEAATSLQQPPLLQFDAQSGTLSIHANQLKLQGVGSIELHCGDAILRLNAQGELLTHAQAITQSAIGAHRIEGASVDIN